MAMVAIFGGPVPQGFHVLAQAVQLLCVRLGEQRLLLDEFVSRRQLFSKDLLLFSHSEQFFFDRHARTSLAVLPFDKSPADLGCYGMFWIPPLFPEDGPVLPATTTQIHIPWAYYQQHRHHSNQLLSVIKSVTVIG